jgi:hypothetical protein
MATIEMTITRALSELKTLQSRYVKSINGLNLVAVKQGSKLRGPNASYKENDFVNNAIEGLQSSDALYARIIAIKSAIDKSNSTTTIKIGSREMTIQEALVYKKFVDLKKAKLQTLQRLAKSARADFEMAINENQSAIEKMISSTVGRDGTDSQKATARKEAEDYIEKTKAVALVDPCEIDKLVKALDEEITEFETNIDYALSESNSTTKISLED